MQPSLENLEDRSVPAVVTVGSILLDASLAADEGGVASGSAAPSAGPPSVLQVGAAIPHAATWHSVGLDPSHTVGALLGGAGDSSFDLHEDAAPLERAGIYLGWEDQFLIDAAGDDFVIGESGSTGEPAPFLVRLRLENDTFTDFLYKPAQEFFSDGANVEGQFLTSFDIADDWNLAAGTKVKAVEIWNALPTDSLPTEVINAGLGGANVDAVWAVSSANLEAEPPPIVIKASSSITGSASVAHTPTGATVRVDVDVTGPGGAVTGGTVLIILDELGMTASANLGALGASASFSLPTSTANGTYHFTAIFIGNDAHDGSVTQGEFDVDYAATTTQVNTNGTMFSTSPVTTTVTASVRAAGRAITGGTVQFFLPGVASPVTATVDANGDAIADITLPAGTMPGSYAVQAQYSGHENLLASSGVTEMSVTSLRPPVVTNPSSTYNVLFNGRIEKPAESGLLTWAYSPDGAPLFVRWNGALPAGLSVASDGSWSYQAPAGFAGTSTFNFWLTDGLNDTEMLTLTFRVGGGPRGVGL